MELRGANALLTGAAGGLAGYIGAALAAEGVDLVLSDIPEAPLEERAAQLRARGVRVETLDADLTDSDAASELVGRAEGAIGPIDLLVNNAGLELGGPFLEREPHEIEALLSVNLLATIMTTRAALPGMLERDRGHVVNMASMAGKLGSPQLAIYSASKHGVVGFTQSLRTEFQHEPVGFSAICPAFISRVGMYGRIEDMSPDLPPGMAALPPERVGAAVVRAICEDKAEILVANRSNRVLIAMHAMAPGLLARLASSRRTREFTEGFIEARRRAPKVAAEQRLEERRS